MYRSQLKYYTVLCGHRCIRRGTGNSTNNDRNERKNGWKGRCMRCDGLIMGYVNLVDGRNLLILGGSVEKRSMAQGHGIMFGSESIRCGWARLGDGVTK